MSASILIIEDNPALALTLRIRIVAAGHSVHCVHTAAAGIEAALDRCPDVIILDLLLPDMDGFELCGKIREHESLNGTKVLFHTVHVQPAFRERAKEVGGDMYLPKRHGTSGVLHAINLLTGAPISPEQERRAESTAINNCRFSA